MFGSKKIYFIRHGQSGNNVAGLRQGSKGGLSEKGREQADFVGKRFEKIPLDLILYSPYDRTAETAEIINTHLQIKTEMCDLLVERKNPSEIVGKEAESIEVRRVMDIIDRSYHQSDYRYSDEENFDDLKVRAKILLMYLVDRKEERIMCVSHRIFLKMVAAYIESGETLTSKEFVKLDFLNTSENASVTFAEYSYVSAVLHKNTKKEQAGWKLMAWNDSGRIV